MNEILEKMKELRNECLYYCSEAKNNDGKTYMLEHQIDILNKELLELKAEVEHLKDERRKS